MKAAGFQIVYDHGVGPFDTNFLPDIISMKNKGVKMFFSTELPDNYAATLAKQFQQQNFKALNIEGAAYSAQLLKLAGSCRQQHVHRAGVRPVPRPGRQDRPCGGVVQQVDEQGRLQAQLRDRVGLRLGLGASSSPRRCRTRATRPHGRGWSRRSTRSPSSMPAGSSLRATLPRPSPRVASCWPRCKTARSSGWRPRPTTGFYCGSNRFLQGARATPRWFGRRRREADGRSPERPVCGHHLAGARAFGDRILQLPHRRPRLRRHLRRERQRPGGHLQHHGHLQLRPRCHGHDAWPTCSGSCGRAGDCQSCCRSSSSCSWRPRCSVSSSSASSCGLSTAPPRASGWRSPWACSSCSSPPPGAIWSPTANTYNTPELFSGNPVSLAGITLSWEQLITVARGHRGGDIPAGVLPPHPNRCGHARRGGRPEPGVAVGGAVGADLGLRLDDRRHVRRTRRHPAWPRACRG